MRSDIVPGAIFPDYEFSDHTGKHRKLSELQGQHPMVVVPGLDPGRADYNSFISFSDPDGNGWLIQEVKKRAPGR
jgi:hypothetical protein